MIYLRIINKEIYKGLKRFKINIIIIIKGLRATIRCLLLLYVYNISKNKQITTIRMEHFRPVSSRRNKINQIYKQDKQDVGQTGRLLKTRISEHQSHIRRNTPTTSVITNHRMHLNHEFDWSNVEILDVERFYYKHISKMLHIKCQRNGLNLQTDTECLDGAYTSIFNYL